MYNIYNKELICLCVYVYVYKTKVKKLITHKNINKS